jgi:hypothetical protein
MSSRRSATSIFALAGLVLALSSAFGQAVQSQNPEEETVHGTVVNSVTHEPVGRALVVSSDRQLASLTDNEGHFALALDVDGKPLSGRFSAGALTARKPGFFENTYWGPVAAGKEVTLALTPEALVIGRVLLPSSEAPDRLEVEIYRRQAVDGRTHWVSAGSTRTKSNGEFRFAELTAGSYKLLTRELLDRDPVDVHPGGQLFGYPPVYFPNATDFEGAETIQLAAGQTVQAALSLAEQPYYSVKVPVAHVSVGTGITVSVSPEGHKGPGYSLGYNANGQIEGLLPNGTYTIEANSFAPIAATGLVTITVKGGAVEGPRLIMLPDRAIPVEVKEEFTSPEDGGSTRYNLRGSKGNLKGPQRYLTVHLDSADDFEHPGGNPGHSSPGEGDDALQIENVRPGRYWVKVRSTRGYASSITAGGVDLRHEPLVVPSSGPIEITMRDDWAEVDGTVEGLASIFGAESPSSSGLFSPEVYFVPQPDNPGEFRDARVAPDGRIDSAQVPPGLYRVLAFDRPQADLEYYDPEVMRSYETQGQLIRLAPGQNEPLRLQMISSSE